MSDMMLTFLSGVSVAVISALGFWAADRRKVRFQHKELEVKTALAHKELETKLATERADDHIALEQTKIAAVEKAVERAETRVERLMQPVLQREIDARIRLENEVLVTKAEVQSLQREVRLVRSLRCPYPQCPVFRAELPE